MHQFFRSEEVSKFISSIFASNNIWKLAADRTSLQNEILDSSSLTLFEQKLKIVW